MLIEFKITLPFAIVTNSPDYQWSNVDSEVWDRLGGREYLSIMLRARNFYSYKYKLSSSTLHRDFDIKSASFKYLDDNNKRRVFTLCYYTLYGYSFLPGCVSISTQPDIMTLDWFLWLFNYRYKVKSVSFKTLNNMSDAELVELCEEVFGRKINIFE